MDRKDGPESNPSRAIERRSASVALTAEPFAARVQAPTISTDPFSAGLPVHDYLRILRKHQWMIVTVVAVMVTVVTIVTFRMSPVYQSSARLEINGELPDMATLQSLFLTLPTDQEFLETQVRILQSDDLAMQCIRSLRLFDKPEFQVRDASAAPGTPFTPAEESRLLDRFRGHLSVQLVRSSRLIEIKFESTDPRLAADAVNKLGELYIENNFRKKYDSTIQAQEWMAGQLRELREKMEKSHEALVKYERDKQIFAISEGQNSTLQKLGDLNKELTLAEAERIVKESQFQLVKSRRIDDLPSIAGNTFITDMQRRLAELSEQSAELRTTYGPNYPKVQKLDQQISEIRSQMDKEKQRVGNRIESEYQAALKREQLLRDAVEKQKLETNQMNEQLVEYSVLKREYDTNQQLYEGLLQRLKEAGLSAGLRANNIHVVDRGRVPLAPVRPRKSINIALSLVVGLVLGAVLAVFNEYLDNSVKVPEEIESLVNLPALGVIPSATSINGYHRKAYGFAASAGAKTLTPVGAGQSAADTLTPLNNELTTLLQPHSVVSEAYRALRTSILLSTSKHPPQTILVTSGQPREGKTTTVLNLAITLAQRGDRVVLIDSDLRRPRVHRAFKLPNDVGLSSFLAGALTIDELPRSVPGIPKLSVVCSGPTPPNPAELLSSESMESLFRELRRQFDFIVLDSPPTITVADSMILAAHADGVVLVVHGGVTTRESLRQAHKMLSSVNARLLGVVLNNVDVRSADYQYYYTYYYGDYYRNMVTEGYSYGHEPNRDSEEQSQRKVAGT